VDGDGNLYIDVSGADRVVISGTYSLNTSSSAQLKFSKDGGSTLETGIVDFVRIGGANSVGDGDTFTGLDYVYAAGYTGTTAGTYVVDYDFIGLSATQKARFAGAAGSDDATHHFNGRVNDAAAYDTVALVPQSGSIDAVGITVYKYGVTTNAIATEGMQVDTYTTADLESGDDTFILHLNGYDFCEIIYEEMQSSANEFQRLQFSSDGGSTWETGSVYEHGQQVGSSNSEALYTYAEVGVGWGLNIGHIKISGATKGQQTFLVDYGKEDTNASAVKWSVVKTTDVYNALKLYCPTGTFSNFKITVYRWNAGGSIDLEGVNTSLDGASKAWGIGSPSGISDSYNASSFTDNGVGRFSTGLTNAMSSTDSPCPSSLRGSAGARIVVAELSDTSTVEVGVFDHSASFNDQAWQYATFGTLA